MDRTFIATAGEETFRIQEGAALGLRGARVLPSPPGSFLVEIPRDGRPETVYARLLADGTWEMWVGRFRVPVSLVDERHAELSGHARRRGDDSGGRVVRAPMPGLIKEIAVAPGARVTRGQRLVILEAMKMENEITAPIDGMVDRCALSAGVSVEKDQELLHLSIPPPAAP